MKHVYRRGVFAFLLLQSLAIIAYPADRDNPLHRDNRPTVAVVDFLGQGFDSNSAKEFSTRFRMSLPGRARLSVLDSGRMSAIRGGSKIRQSRACAGDSCLIEIGRLLGTQFIIGGSIGRTDYIFTFIIKMINLKTGTVIYSVNEDFEQPMPYVFEIVLPQLAERFHDEIVRISFAALAIGTFPKNAKVRLNNEEIGLTPLMKPDIDEGAYRLSLSHENYVDTVDSLYLKKGDTTNKFFNLQPTGEYSKILKEQKRKLKLRIAQSILAFGGIAALSVGGYYESKLGDVAEKNPLFYKYKDRRNIGYIAGAILAAGATATFFF